MVWSKLATLGSRVSNWLSPVLIILAASTTGLAIGWSTGMTGLDSTVLAAVLPVILTGVAGGAGAVVVKIASAWREEPGKSGAAERRLVMFAAIAVICFSTTFLSGTILGANIHARVEERNSTEAVKGKNQREKIRITQRYEYLVRCTGEFVRLNDLRKKANDENSQLNLEPLTIDQVCIGLTLPISSRTPLVALIDDGDFL